MAMEGRTLTGAAVRYGDAARPYFGLERIVPGSFGDRSAVDAVLNAMHCRDRPLTRTGAGLAFKDTAEALSIRAELPVRGKPTTLRS